MAEETSSFSATRALCGCLRMLGEKVSQCIMRFEFTDQCSLNAGHLSSSSPGFPKHNFLALCTGGQSCLNRFGLNPIKTVGERERV